MLLTEGYLKEMNYDLEMTKVINEVYPEKPALVLHACCGPCLSAVLQRLIPNFHLIVNYYNPNIYPAAEHEKRLVSVKKLCKNIYFTPLIKRSYTPDDFYKAVAGCEDQGEGGERCHKCFRLRMENAAKYAKQNNYPFFATTLTISPHKNAAVINQIGFSLEQQYGVRYLPSDFKKRDGYKISIELSKRFSLYRQNYCGCKYSITCEI